MAKDIQAMEKVTTGAKISGVDLNNDGKIDAAKVQKSTASSAAATGIYNIHTPEGRAAFQQALLDIGLTMPEFMAGADSKFISKLSSGDLQALRSLGQSAAGLTSAGTTTPTDTADLQGRWANFISNVNVGGGMDVNALVQFVLREAYMENTKDLHFYAQKVRFYNELKKVIRNELTKAREFLATKAGLKPEESINWNDYLNSTGSRGPLDFPTTPQMENGQPVPGQPTPGQIGGEGGLAANKEGLETYIKNLEEKLNSVGDDAQLANVDLQNMLQKQQQTLQMMSNISKMLHDTAMAIIRKIGS